MISSATNKITVFRVSIVGKANVGKSTLFNKITKRKDSITMDFKGVTRDVIERKVTLKSGKTFLLLDTAGFNPGCTESISRNEYSIQDSNLLLFVIDNKITSEDSFFAEWIRKNAGSSRIVLIRNKTDHKDQDEHSVFGFRDVFLVAAEHGTGIPELLKHIEGLISISEKSTDATEERNQKIKIAILGQPNVGKSTFMNKILGEERSLVSDIAGTTRDPVNSRINFPWKDKITCEFVDTAGLRKKAKVSDKLESISNSRSLKTASESDIVLFMFDVSNFTLEKQDFILINRILDHCKPVILIGNKKDKISDSLPQVREFVELQIRKFLIGEMKIFFISSLEEESFPKLIQEAISLLEKSKQNISSGKLNRWLMRTVERHPHPIVNSKPVKIKYILKKRDKFEFIVRANHPNLVDRSYIQYLRNSIAKDFELNSVPIKITVEKNINPYEKDQQQNNNKPAARSLPKKQSTPNLKEKNSTRGSTYSKGSATDTKQNATKKQSGKRKAPTDKPSSNKNLSVSSRRTSK